MSTNWTHAISHGPDYKTFTNAMVSEKIPRPQVKIAFGPLENGHAVDSGTKPVDLLGIEHDSGLPGAFHFKAFSPANQQQVEGWYNTRGKTGYARFRRLSA